MPSKSGRQHRLMAMVAHDPAAAKRLGIPQSVGKEFVDADKRAGKKFKAAAGKKMRRMPHGSRAFVHTEILRGYRRLGG